jgi:hypothetical protein
MPLTFGAATSDFEVVVAGQFGSTGQAGLIAGWFYPTTLTAGRYWCSLGPNNATVNWGVKVGTTTSTLQLVSGTTTPGLWTATADSTVFPSGVTVNQWHFMAALVSIVTGPTIAWRVWLGTESIAPTPMTIAQNTAPVGTLITASTQVIGNHLATTGTAAFQGDIGMVSLLQCISGVNAPLPIASAGTIATDEALLIEQSYVLPLWLGKHPGHYPRDGATAADWIIWENRQAATYIRQQLSATAATAIARTDGTSSGLTVSRREQPCLSDISANVRLPLVRR